MTLIKTSLLNGIAVAIKMLTLLAINKVLAVYVGPAGYAAIGQFQNAVQMITIFASGAINTGVTKYTAEYHDDEAKQHIVWRTAGTIAFTGSLITSILIALFNQSLAIWFLKDAAYGSVFLWFAATLVLFTFNTLLLAILNGKKDISRYVLANIASSIFSLIATVLMVIQFGLHGALVALAVYQSITFFVTFLLCYRASWFKLKYFFGRIDKKTIYKLGQYTAMALTTVACVPFSHILVRDHIGETLGWIAAGHWDAMLRLSAAYLMLLTSTLSVYYLPKLSELVINKKIKEEIFNGYRIILPFSVFSAFVIYLMRDNIINILFTAEFLPMRELFAWQLIGDVLKIGGWLLGYVLLSKAMLRTFIATEIIFSISFVAMTVIFTNMLGIKGVVLAYALNYSAYWIALACIIKVKLN